MLLLLLYIFFSDNLFLHMVTAIHLLGFFFSGPGQLLEDDAEVYRE